MSSIIKYLLVDPLLFMISIVDSIIDMVYVRRKMKVMFAQLPNATDKHSVIVDKDETSVTYRSANCIDLFSINNDRANLYDTVFECGQKYLGQRIMGYRETLSVDEEKQDNGKIMKKFTLKNEYSWITFKSFINKVDQIANGLLKIGLRSNQNVVLFSETRPEWLMSAVAAFKIKVTVVTLYATLGLEALAFGLNQTNSSYLIVSGEGVLKLQKILDKVKNLTHVIVITDKLTEKNAINLRSSATNLKVYTLSELAEIGRTSDQINDYQKPTKNDLALIMYTSGSTGNPKGVMISHGNILTSLFALKPRMGPLSPEDIYIAYLPLAHILELTSELLFLTHGFTIGYSSPYTLTDNSTAIKQGQMGDIRVLKPSVMVAVPIVLERIKKGVEDQIKTMSTFKRILFEQAYKQKLSKYKAERSALIIDRVIFKRIRDALGGKLRFMLTGGSILNRDVQEFGQVCFCPVVQAYGLTETCATGATQLPNDSGIEHVGGVVECIQVKLVDWPEGNYRHTDKPNPRGEIWIGGDSVSLGYYNMPEKTNEDYHMIDGIRYFATGDIGEMTPNGKLSIIDRKKDLVKLQGGEYVSLNKVETVIKLMPFVDNCCVVANPSKSYCICIITPNVKKVLDVLRSLKDDSNLKIADEQKLLIEFVDTVDNNQRWMDNFDKELFNHCVKHGLERFEIPTKSKFVKETWLPDSGLVTDSLKLKRKEIDNFYSNEIRSIYT